MSYMIPATIVIGLGVCLVKIFPQRLAGFFTLRVFSTAILGKCRLDLLIHHPNSATIKRADREAPDLSNGDLAVTAALPVGRWIVSFLDAAEMFAPRSPAPLVTARSSRPPHSNRYFTPYLHNLIWREP